VNLGRERVRLPFDLSILWQHPETRKGFMLALELGCQEQALRFEFTQRSKFAIDGARLDCLLERVERVPLILELLPSRSLFPVQAEKESVMDLYVPGLLIVEVFERRAQQWGTRMVRVLLIGQKPETVDFSNPDLPYGFTLATIRESLTQGLKQITDRGWHGELLSVLPDETAGPEIAKWFGEHEPYDAVVIGAGIRLPPPNLLFFEQVINAVHRAAPNAAIGFNTRPEETANAVERWITK
jgi:hypothetical protein